MERGLEGQRTNHPDAVLGSVEGREAQGPLDRGWPALATVAYLLGHTKPLVQLAALRSLETGFGGQTRKDRASFPGIKQPQRKQEPGPGDYGRTGAPGHLRQP